ncbi:MAG: oligosaccharide flippase family protein [Gemmatimonadetes bacterium]|nr:oligosaccharide flippase family protein [Gemmatimonadota bacterium]
MVSRNEMQHAVRWTVIGGGVRAAIQLTQYLVLVRLLDAEDFGLMAVVVPYITAAAVTADLGLGSALIRGWPATSDERSSLYWFSLLQASLVGLIVAGAAPLLARWYGEPRLSGLMWICAPSFLFLQAGRQLEVVAERSLSFRVVASTEAAATLVGACLAIGLAARGAGALALAVPVAVVPALRSLLAWMILADGWRPAWRLRFSEVSRFLSFGWQLALSVIASNLCRNLDLLTGGWLLTTKELGTYSVPRGLVQGVVGGLSPMITRVTIPTLSATLHDPSRVARVHRSGRALVTYASTPVLLGAAMFSTPAAGFLFGPEWQGTGSLLALFCITGWAQLIATVEQSAVAGAGRPSVIASWNSMAVVGLSVPFLAAAGFGALPLAATGTAMSLVMLVVAWRVFVRHRFAGGFAGYSAELLAPVAMLAVGWLSSYLLSLAIPQVSAGPRFLLTTILYAILCYRFAPAVIAQLRGLVLPRA